ncbi:WXG100 family type VII secretion target [Herbihabitans rhizosphaerae]|uniref:WXG100 family type VII secretion target n=1 Tax=Herbihabitans rhizosphaerae TaxID=1872711 RepID=UPI00102BD580|nr:WXG100 family type VII secretion target [Herbihabitans rhizosphaerae]
MEPDGVDTFGKLITTASTSVKVIQQYFDHFMQFEGSGGWLQAVRGNHTVVVTAVSQTLGRAGQALEMSAIELRGAAEFYRRTDAQAAGRLDRTYPPGSMDGRPPLDRIPAGPVNLDSIGTIDNMRRHLPAPPPKPEEFTDPLKYFNIVDDFMSPTWWMNQVLNDTVRVNPLEETTKWIAGEWESYARCAMTWKYTSQAIQEVHDKIKFGMSYVGSLWHGNAADAALQYFDYILKALRSLRTVTNSIHEKYMEIARGVWQAAKSLADVLKGLLDNLVVAGIALIASRFLIWTGVGTAISWGVAALQCVRIVDLWQDATRILTTTQKAIHGVMGFVQSMEPEIQSRPIPMPATDYNHPAVR